jgi:ParB/RepB/Spo0J family partition protein
MTQQPTIVYVPVDDICFNRFQQTGFHNEEKINEIASSILQNRDNGTKGLLQVPTARKVTDDSIENGLTELAFGHHRYLAIKKLAESDPFFSEMPLILRDLSDLEMFELMAIENFHRRDIDPLEEANTFHAYMTTFGKTSVETAQKFEKSEEYVRQSIRLLNLPEAAQDLVKNGTLTKTDARDLLVLNKLGGDELVLEALDEITSQDVDDDVPAKNVIERTLRMSNETKNLDMNDDWVKANKKFPVKHLKTITKDDVRNTLKRVATYQDDEAFEDAIAGVVMLITSGMELMDEAWPMFTSVSLDRLRVLANPGPCEKCPIHAVVDGDHFCGVPLCFTRKERAWELHKVDQMVEKIGVPLWQKTETPWVALSRYEAADQKLWNEGHADLRLKPAKYVWNNFEGLDANWQVVVVGDTAAKRLKKTEAKKSVAEVEKVDRAKEETITKLKRDFCKKFNYEYLARAFDGLFSSISNPAMLEYIADGVNQNPEYPNGIDDETLRSQMRSAKFADQIKIMRRYAAFCVIDQRSYDAHLIHGMDDKQKKFVVQYAKEYKPILEELGLVIPKDYMQEAEKYQAELDKALKEIA